LPSLLIKSSFGYNTVNLDENIRTPLASIDPSSGSLGSAFFGKSQNKNWIMEPQAEYNKSFKKVNKIQVLAGMTWSGKLTSRNSISASGYSNDNLLGSTTGAQSLESANGFVQYRYAALFARFNYEYDQKYLINLTGRRDASSRFGPDHRFANFGAIGAAWVFSKEKFMSRVFPFLSYGKLRGSYGITGNDLIQDYQYIDSYTGTQYPYQGSPSLRPSRLFNPTYSWEQIKKTELSIELGFLKDRLLLTANWFNHRSDNQIIRYSLPGQTGFTSILTNFPGVVQNRGWELAINSTNVSNANFHWTSSFNITIPKNKLVAFPGLASTSYASQFIIGKPLNLNIGYHFLGVNKQTGIYEFEDINKDNSIDEKDYIYTGTRDPVFYGGMNNSIGYRGWQVDFLFEFRKQKGTDPIYGKSGLVGDGFNQPVALLNHWTQPGDISPYQKYSQKAGPAATAGFLISESSANLTDASFTRLKNLSLSYELSRNWVKKMKMEKCRIYFMAQNLILFTKYKGADPENQSLFSLPPLRMITLGIQITL
jgi:TonB-dependent starch-binding outer membrane protein SusC